MRQFTYATQDASIYQAYTSVNTGIDEILEVGKSVITSSVPASLTAVRSLVQFDVSSLAAAYTAGTIPPNTIHYLNLRLAHAQGFSAGQQLQVFAVSQSWVEGTGYFIQQSPNPQDGVTWLQTDNNGDLWPSGTGGTVITSGAPSASITFGYPPSDVRLDVTSFVQAWVSGAIPNYGFLLKLNPTDEGNVLAEANLKFFSSQTHTIYRPTLESVWNSQTYVTGSNMNPAPAYYTAYFRNLQPVYYSGSSIRVDVGVRPTYPLKNFDTVFTFAPIYFLPTSSYVSVIDAQTNASVIPFDSGSLLNCDASGSYFVLSTQNLYTNRWYRLRIRVDQNGTSNVLDDNVTFRVK